uniref:RNA helicase n=2 Tax=Ascaris suum TaxID=6253 RepID=F1KUT1_ASCSU
MTSCLQEEDPWTVATELQERDPSAQTKVDCTRLNDAEANVASQETSANQQGQPVKKESIKERDRAFWEEAAARQSPFVPSASLQGNTYSNSDLQKNSFRSFGMAPSARRISQESGGERLLWSCDGEPDLPMPSEEISLLNKIIHKKLENLQQGSVQISQLQSDPSSPLYSANTFESLRLKEELLKALRVMGFLMPSKIQEAALPLLLIEPPQNMIAQSQSGTGKTAAFVLTMLSRVVTENKWPQCLCLAPTYELAMQIGEVVSTMSQYMPDVRIRYALRGERISRGENIEEQIVIGTPGKMLDWVVKMKAIDASKIICMVFDEADVMISQQGHRDQSIRLKNELERSGAKYQSLLFSATYDDAVIAFAESIIKEAVVITVRREEQTLSNIKQYYVKCANREEKYEAVINLYGGLTIASAIIFCYTRKSAEWLAARMSARGHVVTLLHGELPIEERARVIQCFKEGIYKVLVTTNVCARGIDVSQVTVVINYDPPLTFSETPQPDYETYLHRIGRTGRFGKAGIAINFVSNPFEVSVIERIGQHFGKEIELLDASDFDALEAIDKDGE